MKKKALRVSKVTSRLTQIRKLYLGPSFPAACAQAGRGDTQHQTREEDAGEPSGEARGNLRLLPEFGRLSGKVSEMLGFLHIAAGRQKRNDGSWAGRT